MQWHGAYEILSDLAELREMTDAELAAYSAATTDQAAPDTTPPGGS